MNYLKLMRVHQWVKNGFVFLPIFFAGKLLNWELLYNSIFSFFAFSFIASSVYILNDYVDIESDKMHPEKRKRPLASGKVSKIEAKILFVVLWIFSFIICSFINPSKYYSFGDSSTKDILMSFRPEIVLMMYFIMNVAYSFKLKHVAIIDVSIISIGFLFRVLLGGYSTNLRISFWTILLTFFLALLMGIAKRRGELLNINLKGDTRKALNGYNLQFLDFSLIVVSTSALLSYIMFAVEEGQKYGKYMMYTSLFVVIGILRYLQLTFVYNRTESPTKVIFKDLFLQVIILLFILFFFIVQYTTYL